MGRLEEAEGSPHPDPPFHWNDDGESENEREGTAVRTERKRVSSAEPTPIVAPVAVRLVAPRSVY
jgi:hypothetical protein